MRLAHQDRCAARTLHPLAGIGFPVTGGQVELDQFTAEYEGETHSRDPATGAELRLLKLKAGQIDYGFSGGPLLNRRTGRIVGVTRLSRDTRSDLGGWAIPTREVMSLCTAAGIAPSSPSPPDLPTAELRQRGALGTSRPERSGSRRPRG